jgi:hypothetical protein
VNTRSAALFISLLVLAGTAWANAGIPMLALTWPAQWIAFIPVVGIEAVVLAKALKTAVRPQLWPVAKANLLSTLVGVPLAWCAMLIAEFIVAGAILSRLPASFELPVWAEVLLFPFTAAWIGGSGAWEIEIAFLVLAVPFCIVSIYAEHRALKAFLPDADAMALRSAVRQGNVLTYCCLCLVVALSFWAT